jgi:hypothetical protein
MVERKFHWTCDFCNSVKEKIAHGLPKDWKYLNANILRRLPIQHVCEKCLTTLPEIEKLRLPKE